MGSFIGKKIQIAKDKISAGDKGGSFVFETVKELFIYLEISPATYYNQIGKIRDAGFQLNSLTITDKKIQIAKE